MGTAAVGVKEASGVPEVRRTAAGAALRAGLNEERTGRVAIIATEAATNLLRHAGEGEVLVSIVNRGAQAGVEIIALDNGPGIGNVEEAKRDGFSTVGGSGTGLGAIVRLASEHAIYTVPNKGTAILARVFPDREVPPAAEGELEFGGVAVPKAGEVECGDAFAVRPWGAGVAVVVADGLGHGPEAAYASARAVAAFEDAAGADLTEMMERIHGALRSTRGAAVALAHVCASERSVEFISVGNVAGAVITPAGTRQMVSYPGTVGHEMQKVPQFRYEFPPGAMVLLHSDGIGNRWNMESYPGLEACDPVLIAAVVYRDFKRVRDDSTVVIIRRRRAA